MIGPARSVHGGISGVVNNYYEAGLDQKVRLCYIGTMVEGSRMRKLFQAAWALLLFACKLPFYQIVHVNVASDASFVRKSFFIRLSKFFRKKIVIHQHGGDFETYYGEQNENKKEMVRKVLAMGDVFLTLAPSYQNFFESITGRTDILVFPDAIKITEKSDKIYGQQKMLFLGRICREKGIEELLQAMKELHTDFPNAKLYLGGIFEDPELENRIKECEDYITWLGWISGAEKERYLQDCDIFVLPSYFEGQSVAILEAMAHSCAVVASQVGGIVQMIVQDQTGVLIKPHDAASLKKALERVFTDQELCSRLGRQAREKVEKEFSIDRNMEELTLIYQKLLPQQ